MTGARPDAPETTSANEEPSRSFQDLMVAARNGDASAVPALRRALLENPELMRANGDVSCRTQKLWIDLIAGRDLFRRECLLIRMRQLKHELVAETQGTVAEQMLVELAISTWLQLFYHEQKEARDPASDLSLGEFRLRKIESAFNRHMRVLGSLTALRTVRFTQRMVDTMAAVAGQQQQSQTQSQTQQQQQQSESSPAKERPRNKPVNRLMAVSRN